MQYEDIAPTHNSLRNVNTFRTFIENPQLLFNCDNPITMYKIDDRFYLHDGHHRMSAAMFLSIPIEQMNLRIASYKYSDIFLCNPKTGWLTPFHPEYEVRSNDCMKFKNMVLDAISSHGSMYGLKFMAHNRNMYVEKRVALNIKDLIPNEYIDCK